MTWRRLTMATAFLAIAGIAYAQDVPGTPANSTPIGGFEQRDAPAPAIGAAEEVPGPVVNWAPLGGIERRDVPGAKFSALRYTIRANQTFETGAVPNGTGTPVTSGVSGTLAYNSNSARNQFGTTYSGGGGWTNQTATSDVNFHNFELGDTLTLRRFTLTGLNVVSYLPQSPIGGSSGIPGMGDLSGTLGFGMLAPTIAPNQTILTQNSQRISNATAGSVMLNLTGRTSVTALGSYGILRFLDTGGYDMNQGMAGMSVNHRFSARDTVGVNYLFASFAYNDTSIKLNTHEAFLMYERLWSRRWRSDFKVGPQWVESTGTPSSQTHTYVAGSASITYDLTAVTSADLRYIRGVSGGSGVLTGSKVDTVELAAMHSFGRSWTASLIGSYSRNADLFLDQLFTTKSAGAQLTRKLGRDFSCYFSYTAVDQTSSGAQFGAPVNVLQGLYHVFGFGVEFTSRPVRIRGV